jgi:hypothetical protein
MNSRGRINCPSESCLAGCSFPTPAWSAPAFHTKWRQRRPWGCPFPWSPPFIALRALVPSGLACVLARPLYDEAQTAIWVARWAKLPKAARRRLITQRRAANFLKFNGVG